MTGVSIRRRYLKVLFHFKLESLRIIWEVKCLLWWRTMLRAILLELSSLLHYNGDRLAAACQEA
jgi:hypothetical protein